MIPRDTPDTSRRPTHPYVPGPRVLEVPSRVLSRTVELLGAYAPRRLEACCFWYGVEGATIDRVTCVALPRQENGWGWYDVDAAAMAELSRATRSRRWVNVAQLHTHPSSWVEHSPFDDEKANSRRAVSIVLPNYGVWRGAWPIGVGIHEYQAGWHTLSDVDAAARIVLIESDETPNVVDLRD